MVVTRQTVKFVDHFDRNWTYATGVPDGLGWVLTDVSAAGTPTYAFATEDGGKFVMTIVNTNEAESLTYDLGDVLPYDWRMIDHMWFVGKVATVDNVSDVTLGLTGAAGATPAERAWFMIDGSASTSVLYVATDDATTDSGLISTGTTLAATYKEMKIDFTNGIDDVRFFVDGARVADGTTFSMSGLTAGNNAQRHARVLKASGTGTPILTLAEFGIQYRYAL